jgi:acetylornithine aminotransferase/acetylornithine/N-succinyldiaminopimelate aminotransferase
LLHTLERQKVLKHVQKMGAYMLRRLEELQAKNDAIRELRGLGLMIGMEMESAELAKTVFKQLLDRGIVVNRTDETVIRFLPPFIVQKKHVDHAIRQLEQVLANNTAVVATAEKRNG